MEFVALLCNWCISLAGDAKVDTAVLTFPSLLLASCAVGGSPIDVAVRMAYHI